MPSFSLLFLRDYFTSLIFRESVSIVDDYRHRSCLCFSIDYSNFLTFDSIILSIYLIHSYSPPYLSSSTFFSTFLCFVSTSFIKQVVLLGITIGCWLLYSVDFSCDQPYWSKMTQLDSLFPGYLWFMSRHYWLLLKCYLSLCCWPSSNIHLHLFSSVTQPKAKVISIVRNCLFLLWSRLTLGHLSEISQQVWYIRLHQSNIQIIISTVSQLQNQPFDIIGQVIILWLVHEKLVCFIRFTIFRQIFTLVVFRQFSGHRRRFPYFVKINTHCLMHLFWADRFCFLLIFILNFSFVTLKEVIEFETSFLLGVEAADVALNHFILSHVNLLGLFYNLSDVVPFKFLLIIFKNMFCLERKQNIGPLYHMGLDTLNFNELKNGCI